MRVKETAAIAVALILVPFLAATVSAQRPSGWSDVPEYEFNPVPMEARAFEPTPAPTPRPRSTQVIIDTFGVIEHPTARPQVVQPTPGQVTIIKPPPGGVVTGTGHSVTGKASWYCGPTAPVCANGYPMGGPYAAAGPALRTAMGGCPQTSCPQPWRGDWVKVCRTGTSTCTEVQLIDWCQCHWKTSIEKVIDLYNAPFNVVGSNVTLSW